MRAVTFTVPGQPVGKGRARVGRAGGFVRMFTPEKTATYESTIALFADQAMAGQALITGPVRLRLICRFAIPDSWSKKKRGQALQGAIYPATKPDADNITKAVCDAVNGIVWKDDAQVVELSVKKWYALNPGVTAIVEEMGRE